VKNHLEPLERVHVCIQGIRADSAIQSDSKAGRVPGGSVLVIVLKRHGGAGRTADLFGSRSGRVLVQAFRIWLPYKKALACTNFRATILCLRETGYGSILVY